MKQKPSDKADPTGIMLVALGAISFSTSIIFARLVRGLDAASIALFRATAGFLFFCFLLPHSTEGLKIRQYRHLIRYLIGLGLAVGATATLYMYAVRQTTAANAVLLNNTSVIYVALLAPWLLKESRPRNTWLSLALAMLGVICIADPAHLDLHSGNFMGILAAACSGMSYTFTMLFSRMLRGQVSGITQAWWSIGLAALVALPWSARPSWTAVWPNLLWLIALGTLSLGIPYMLYFLGLQRVDAQVVSFIALLEPVSGILIGLSIYREIPTPIGIVGIILVLASIVLISR